MDRGSFRAGNDLRLYRPRLNARLETDRMTSERQEIIYNAFLRDRSDGYVRIGLYFEASEKIVDTGAGRKV